MRLEESVGDAGTPEGFLELPRLIYGEDPTWIPEDSDSVVSAFSGQNRWFSPAKKREARCYCVPAKARATVFFEPGQCIDGERACFFGYWESVGDAEAEQTVMEAVRDFARARGAQRLYGPIQFSTAHSYRLRLTVEEGGLPFDGEPYNPLSYPDRLEALGFAVCTRYITQVIDHRDAPAVARDRGRFLERVTRRGHRIEPLDRRLWRARSREIHALVVDGFQGNFAFVPPTYEEFESTLGVAIPRKLSPELSFAAFSPSGELAGFCIVSPQYAPLLMQSRGALRLRAKELDWETHAPLLDGAGPLDIVIKSIVVKPAFRALGVGPALVTAVTNVVRDSSRYRTVFGALIRNDNGSRRLTLGCAAERTYALYQCGVE